MSLTKREQYLDFNLVRSGRLSTNELALLQVINSYSRFCSLKQEVLARAINKSVATIKRTIQSLIEKGFISKRYTKFKKCVLTIVSMAKQRELLGPVGAIKQAFKYAKTKVRRSGHSSPMSGPDSSPMSESTRSKTQEKKQEKPELNFFQKDAIERAEVIKSNLSKFSLFKAMHNLG